MTHKFRNFLKENNAYENYIRNNNGESENPFTYFDNFLWSSSAEGYDYWSELDNKWFDLIDEKIYLKDKNEYFNIKNK